MRSKIYDVTGWNLGHLMGLDSWWIDQTTVPFEVQGNLLGAHAWGLNGERVSPLQFAALAMETGLGLHVPDRELDSKARGKDGALLERSSVRGSFLMPQA